MSIANPADQSSPVIINNFQAAGLQSKKKGWTTFWLCGFFGFLGVHRFYLGHVGLGLIYLFTGGLFFIGAFVDLFMAWHITAKENRLRGYGFVSK